MAVPLIDIGPLVTGKGDVAEVARQIGAACREIGFFYVENHGVDAGLETALETASRRFFELDADEKMTIPMANAGRAWRGYFPVGGELTSGMADLKEGIYFGSELDDGHPDVRAGLPLHGANLFPSAVPELRPVVLDYLAALTQLGHALMRGLSLSLGLDAAYFDEHVTHDPLVLFRIFNYPAPKDPSERTQWGVGEHTDYGVLTILKQDDCGGLEVNTSRGWMDAPPIANTFVCNIGDMLDRMTGGRYRSTPHRVRNPADRDRRSWPFFFDPGFHTAVRKLPLPPEETAPPTSRRWDDEDVHAFEGTYGEYVMRKVSRVFPQLKGAQGRKPLR
jgi:isopenicillin N synthase-like dioxygenase